MTNAAPLPTGYLVRLPDWHLRFDDLVFSRLRAPFCWGSNDCVLFAADCVLAITGVDLAADFRGLGARDAMRLVRQRGGMLKLVPAALRPLLHVAGASEGDIAMLPADHRGRMALTVCTMGGVVAPSRDGLLIAPRECATHAWRVG